MRTILVFVVVFLVGVFAKGCPQRDDITRDFWTSEPSLSGTPFGPYAFSFGKYLGEKTIYEVGPPSNKFSTYDVGKVAIMDSFNQIGKSISQGGVAFGILNVTINNISSIETPLGGNTVAYLTKALQTIPSPGVAGKTLVLAYQSYIQFDNDCTIIKFGETIDTLGTACLFDTFLPIFSGPPQSICSTYKIV